MFSLKHIPQENCKISKCYFCSLYYLKLTKVFDWNYQLFVPRSNINLILFYLTIVSLFPDNAKKNKRIPTSVPATPIETWVLLRSELALGSESECNQSEVISRLKVAVILNMRAKARACQRTWLQYTVLNFLLIKQHHHTIYLICLIPT